MRLAKKAAKDSAKAEAAHLRNGASHRTFSVALVLNALSTGRKARNRKKGKGAADEQTDEGTGPSSTPLFAQVPQFEPAPQPQWPAADHGTVADDSALRAGVFAAQPDESAAAKGERHIATARWAR